MQIATFFIAVSSLLQLSAAQPRRRHAKHEFLHRRAFPPKEGRITVVDTAISQPTEATEVVVYVDQFGNPVHTATETVVVNPVSAMPPPTVSSLDPAAPPAAAAPTSNASANTPPPAPPAPPAPAPAVPSDPAPKIVASNAGEEPVPTAPAAPPVAPPTSAAAAPKSTSSAASSDPIPPTSQGSNLHGVTYSPYKGSGGCKSAAEVDADFALFAKDHGVVRIYGVDCDQVATTYAAAKKNGNKLMLGIFDINGVADAVKAMSAGVKNDWSIVDTVSVGNELVNNGGASVEQVLGAVDQARTALRAAGYNGPVVTVDTFIAAINNPALCDKSDYCAVNVHPFFDPNTGSDQAGKFITNTITQLRSKLSDPNKRIVVTETGWPWKGNANGAAVPGLDTQAKALSSIRSAFTSNPGDCILFTAFNDPWKVAAPETFYAEQFWGMGGVYSPSDQ